MVEWGVHGRWCAHAGGAAGRWAARMVLAPRRVGARRRGGSKSESNFGFFDFVSIVSIRGLIGIFLGMILSFIMMILPLFR